MPTYVSTSRNQFRVPAGAVNDPPDVPGYMLTAQQDVDDRVGVGGAEYCATATALLAIPSSRRFLGKLAYRADTDTVYRYMGAGNTAVGANNATAAWQGWSKPATPITGISMANVTVGASTVTGLWGIAEGLFWLDFAFTAGTGFALGGGGDVAITIPSPVVAMYGGGSGQYQKAGSVAAGQQVALACYGVGTAGQSTTAIRLRALVGPATAGQATTQNILASAIGSTVTDTFQVHFSAPSALNA